MDNLQSSLHEVVDHHDHVEIDFGRGAAVHTLAPKAAVTPTTAGTGWYHDAAIEAARHEAVEAHCNPYHR